MNDLLEVSIVIPTRNRPELLNRCLKALQRQTVDPRRMEIMVVDDGPSSKTKAVVDAFQHQSPIAIRYLPTSGGRGPAAARNLGWQNADAPAIAFTDDDTLPDEDWILEGLMALHDGADAVTGRVIVPLPDHPTDYELNTAGLEGAEFVTANCFCWRAVLHALGGFDERFATAWREDSDLHFRLLDAGMTIVRAETAIIYHPVRPAPWGTSLRQQRNNLFDALLHKKHGSRHHRRLQRVPASYYMNVAAIIGAAAAVPAHAPMLALAFSAAWLLTTAWFCLKRLRRTVKSPAHVGEMLLTSVLIPPLAISWRIRGAWRFRTWFC